MITRDQKFRDCLHRGLTTRETAAETGYSYATVTQWACTERKYGRKVKFARTPRSAEHCAKIRESNLLRWAAMTDEARAAFMKRRMDMRFPHLAEMTPAQREEYRMLSRRKRLTRPEALSAMGLA